MQGEVSTRERPERPGASCHSTERMSNRDGGETAQKLRGQAARCRRLARDVTDRTVSQKLFDLALEFEERADALEAADDPERLGRALIKT
jgi:hypothetical protein